MVRCVDDGFVAIIINFPDLPEDVWPDRPSYVTVCTKVTETLKTDFCQPFYNHLTREVTFCIKLARGTAASTQTAKELCAVALEHEQAFKCSVQLPSKHIIRGTKTSNGGEHISSHGLQAFQTSHQQAPQILVPIPNWSHDVSVDSNTERHFSDVNIAS